MKSVAKAVCASTSRPSTLRRTAPARCQRAARIGRIGAAVARWAWRHDEADLPEFRRPAPRTHRTAIERRRRCSAACARCGRASPRDGHAAHRRHRRAVSRRCKNERRQDPSDRSCYRTARHALPSWRRTARVHHAAGPVKKAGARGNACTPRRRTSIGWQYITPCFGYRFVVRSEVMPAARRACRRRYDAQQRHAPAAGDIIAIGMPAQDFDVGVVRNRPLRPWHQRAVSQRGAVEVDDQTDAVFRTLVVSRGRAGLGRPRRAAAAYRLPSARACDTRGPRAVSGAAHVSGTQ